KAAERDPARPPHWNESHAAEERDERASPHSITSSARARSVAGTVMPSASAVLQYHLGGALARQSGLDDDGGAFFRSDSRFTAAALTSPKFLDAITIKQKR